MAIQPKIRPSLSIPQAAIIHESLKLLMANLMQQSAFHDPKFMECVGLQKYFTELLGSQHMGQQQAIQRAYANNGIIKTEQEIPVSSVQLTGDFLNDPNLTDEQKYDILLLQDEKTYTPEQIEFSNTVGFKFKMARMMKAKSVGEGEL